LMTTAIRLLSLGSVTDQQYRQGVRDTFIHGKAVLHQLIEEARDHLEPGGSFYAVVRTKQGAASLKKFIAETYGNADEPEIGGGYRVIRAHRE
jgi:16S rRNA G1207 methylase RsmC